MAGGSDYISAGDTSNFLANGMSLCNRNILTTICIIFRIDSMIFSQHFKNILASLSLLAQSKRHFKFPEG